CPLQLLWPYGRTLLGCRAAAQQRVLIGLQNTSFSRLPTPWCTAQLFRSVFQERDWSYCRVSAISYLLVIGSITPLSAPFSNAQFYKLKLYTALSFNKQDMILLPPCCLFAQHGVIVMPDT